MFLYLACAAACGCVATSLSQQPGCWLLWLLPPTCTCVCVYVVYVCVSCLIAGWLVMNSMMMVHQPQPTKNQKTKKNKKKKKKPTTTTNNKECKYKHMAKEEWVSQPRHCFCGCGVVRETARTMTNTIAQPLGLAI